MPTYVYACPEGAKGCPACLAGFDVLLGMNEPGPATCPRCGAKVERRISAPGLVTKHNERNILSDSNLKRHGFKTLRNEGSGRFHVS